MAKNSESNWWTARHEARALKHGWCIEFGCAGSRIRRARVTTFASDSEAVAYVAARAMCGFDALAQDAIRFLVEDHNLEASVVSGVPPVEQGGSTPSAAS